jgi:protein ImuA
MRASNADIIRQLQRDILPLQGFKPPTAGKAVDFQIEPIEMAFPNHRFPTGAIHELITRTPQQSAATHGFLSALLAPLMEKGGACLWIGGARTTSDPGRTTFAPGLPIYGVSPDRILFLELPREQDRAWAMEEALKCEALTAVVGEIADLSFTDSRRLQLAVEQSRVTGFLIRPNPRNLGTVASVARWEINALPSEPEEGLPGIGFPRWQITLHKVRNGQPGTWTVEWAAGRFHFPAGQNQSTPQSQSPTAQSPTAQSSSAQPPYHAQPRIAMPRAIHPQKRRTG